MYFSHLVFNSYSGGKGCTKKRKKRKPTSFLADHLQTWHEEIRCTCEDIICYFMITVFTGSKFLGWKRKKRILGSSGKSLETELTMDFSSLLLSEWLLIMSSQT